MKIFLKYYLPVLIWAFLIFYFSSSPDLKSGLEETYDLILRKAVHMIEFGVLAVLLLRIGLRGETRNKGFVYILVILFSILYAVTDEYHQSFVIGRESSIRDVLIDSIGIVGGAGIYLIVKKG